MKVKTKERKGTKREKSKLLLKHFNVIHIYLNRKKNIPDLWKPILYPRNGSHYAEQYIHLLELLTN